MQDAAILTLATGVTLPVLTDGAAQRNALVTGATGYVGGRLVPQLLQAGYLVRCFAATQASFLINRGATEWRS